MSENENNFNELEAYKAILFEKQRIEDFLRAENKNLWQHLNNYKKLPFFNLYIYISEKLQNFILFFKQTRTSWVSDLESNNSRQPKVDKNFTIQALFVLPSNRIEIGGLQTAYKLAVNLSNLGLNSKVICVTSDPSSEINDIFLDHESINLVETVNLIIACGAESISLADQLGTKYRAKKILLMQGPDHYFTPDWENSKNFVSAIRSYDYVVTISHFLFKLASQYRSNNIIFTPLGYDNQIFKIFPGKRTNQIVVACRSNIEKGLKILLPQIPEIRRKGWRVVGFGDLNDPQMAEVFDEFFGRVNNIRLYEIFSKSKILLDPSLIEGLGLIPLEAAASGVVPIVAKRHSYEGFFKNGERPFVEIDDFQNPVEVLKAIDKADKMDNHKVAEIVKDANWENGLEIFVNQIKQILSI